MLQKAQIFKSDKIKPFILVVVYILLMVWLASCQQPEVEIEVPDQEKSFTKNSTLGNYVHGISLLDGTGDNIIDDAKNLKIEFPVDVLVNGNPVEVNDLSDLVPIRDQYDLNPYVQDFMSIQYPIEVIKSDYSKLIINSETDLKEAIKTSYNGIITDVSCVDFNYPINLSTYDLINQKAGSLQVEDDRALFHAFKNLGSEELISLNYPITISVHGASQMINNNIELQQIIEDEISACNEKDFEFYSDTPLTYGSLKLLLTDAPFPIDEIEEANVTIDRIDAKTGAANDSIPKITLFNDSLSFNLIELTNGVTADLSEFEIPVGTYDHFRVYVRNGSILLKDGRSFDLTVPSGSESGILIKPSSPITITEEGTSEFLFDFDLSRSFILKGNPDNIVGFNFRPVIKVSDMDLTGILKGKATNTLNMPVEGVQITLLAADTINTTIFTGAGGNYTVLGLTPGAYTLEAEKEGFEMLTSEDIVIGEKETTVYNFNVTAL